jgi:hypothetical protein
MAGDLSGGLIALIGVLAGKRKEGQKAGARRIPRGCGGGRRAGGRRKGRGRREADRWGPGVSDSKIKRKEGEVGWRGAVRWAGRPGWAERGAGKVLFFFLFHFQTSFSNHFSLQIQIKLFQAFSQKFINFLETTQAIKNHANQLMMHKHLLSLSLLNYV